MHTVHFRQIVGKFYGKPSILIQIHQSIKSWYQCNSIWSFSLKDF